MEPTTDLEMLLDRPTPSAIAESGLADLALRTHDIPLRGQRPLVERIAAYVRDNRGAIADKTAAVTYSLCYGLANELGNAGFEFSEFLKTRIGMTAANFLLGDKYRELNNRWLKLLHCDDKHEIIKTVAELPLFNAFWLSLYAGVTYASGADAKEIQDAIWGGIVSSPILSPTYRWYNRAVRKAVGADKEMV